LKGSRTSGKTDGPNSAGSKCNPKEGRKKKRVVPRCQTGPQGEPIDVYKIDKKQLGQGKAKKGKLRGDFSKRVAGCRRKSAASRPFLSGKGVRAPEGT